MRLKRDPIPKSRLHAVHLNILSKKSFYCTCVGTYVAQAPPGFPFATLHFPDSWEKGNCFPVPNGNYKGKLQGFGMRCEEKKYKREGSIKEVKQVTDMAGCKVFSPFCRVNPGTRERCPIGPWPKIKKKSYRSHFESRAALQDRVGDRLPYRTRGTHIHTDTHSPFRAAAAF